MTPPVQDIEPVRAAAPDALTSTAYTPAFKCQSRCKSFTVSNHVPMRLRRRQLPLPLTPHSPLPNRVAEVESRQSRTVQSHDHTLPVKRNPHPTSAPGAACSERAPTPLERHHQTTKLCSKRRGETRCSSHSTAQRSTPSREMLLALKRSQGCYQPGVGTYTPLALGKARKTNTVGYAARTRLGCDSAACPPSRHPYKFNRALEFHRTNGPGVARKWFSTYFESMVATREK